MRSQNYRGLGLEKDANAYEQRLRRGGTGWDSREWITHNFGQKVKSFFLEKSWKKSVKKPVFGGFLVEFPKIPFKHNSISSRFQGAVSTGSGSDKPKEQTKPIASQVRSLYNK